jgi:hypothetical protein
VAPGGDLDTALATIPTATTQAEKDEERWCQPELLRVQGEIVLMRAGPDASAAPRSLFTRSLELARAHRVPAWEQRAASSLARHCIDVGRSAEAPKRRSAEAPKRRSARASDADSWRVYRGTEDC